MDMAAMSHMHSIRTECKQLPCVFQPGRNIGELQLQTPCS